MSSVRDWIERIVVWLATGLGAGTIRYAPGTVGTLWGVPLAWAILSLPHLGLQLLVILVLLLLGIPICGVAARRLNLKDPGSVVWDEFTALPIVFLGFPAAAMSSPLVVVLGFVLFRVFDISKLAPARQLERLPGGWGVMSDDVAASLYALLVMRGIVWIWPGGLTTGS